MAFVDKISLRNEFSSLKDQFESLKSKENISSETQILFKSMIILFEVLITIFLEKKTKKTSRNSSIPPSQSDKDTTSTQKGSNGKGQTQNVEVFDQVKMTEKTQVAEVNFCTHCGEDLKNHPTKGKERRTQIDILFEKSTLHIDAEIKDCPACEGETKGWFPSSFKGPLQYGTGVKVFVLNLFVAQMIPLKRVQKLVQSLIGRAVSEATILR